MNALKELIRVFGVPSILGRGASETGCSVGGRNGYRIIKRGRETGCSIGGPMGNSIILGKQRIGFIAVSSVQRIYASDGRRTNYFVGGETERKIMYLVGKNRNSKP